MYGFYKVKSEQADACFAHDLFQKNGSGLQKIKRMKLCHDKSEDEEDDDEIFVEKRTQVRANRNNITQNKEIESFESEIKELNEKVKKFEDAALGLRTTIEKQHNDIKALFSELTHLRQDGNQKIDILLKELFAAQRSGSQELFIENSISAQEKKETSGGHFTAAAENRSRTGDNREYPSKQSMWKNENQNGSIFENLAKTHENSSQSLKNLIQREQRHEAWMDSQSNPRTNKPNISSYSYSMQTAPQHDSNEWVDSSERQQTFSHAPSYCNQNLIPSWEYQEDFYYHNDDDNIESFMDSFPFKKVQKISLNESGPRAETEFQQSQAYYYS